MQKNNMAWGCFLGVIVFLASGSSFAAEEISYEPGKRRDPFVPLTGENSGLAMPSASGFRLEGIIYDPRGRSMAILNGKTYEAGETAGDAMIVRIERDHVVISVEGEEKILWIRVEEKV